MDISSQIDKRMLWKNRIGCKSCCQENLKFLYAIDSIKPAKPNIKIIAPVKTTYSLREFIRDLILYICIIGTGFYIVSLYAEYKFSRPETNSTANLNLTSQNFTKQVIDLTKFS